MFMGNAPSAASAFKPLGGQNTTAPSLYQRPYWKCLTSAFYLYQFTPTFDNTTAKAGSKSYTLRPGPCYKFGINTVQSPFCYLLTVPKWRELESTPGITPKRNHKFAFFFSQLVKTVNRVSKKHVCRPMWVRYVLKDFCNFSMVTKNVKSIGQNYSPFFSNERHFEIWFPKMKTTSEVNYLNYTKKIQFCMWQPHFP